MNLLELESLTKRFDGLIANENVNFKLSKGEIQSIIGPNGAGKTTLISMISGHLAPSEGRILFEQQDITSLSVAQRGRLGIIRKFQTPSVFLGLNVYDNIELASIAGGVRRKQLSKEVSAVFDLIGLGDQRFQLASTLSHGHRQWLEIGLLLAAQAKLLLLDEPTAGMTVEETNATVLLIQNLTRNLGLSAIVIEHDINFIKNLKAPVTVLHLGKVFSQGSFQEIANNPSVKSIYLGTE